MKRFIIIVALCFSAAGCKEYVDTPLSPAEKKRIESARLAVAPTPGVPHDVMVEDQLKLIGVDLSNKSVKAGENVVVTFYLEAMNDAMEDNKIFIHFISNL